MFLKKLLHHFKAKFYSKYLFKKLAVGKDKHKHQCQL
jgi:hypothetical protein